MKEIHVKDGTGNREIADAQSNGRTGDGGSAANNIVAETSRMPFLMLGLDLPPPPLFKDVMEKNIIPQVCA